MAIQIYKTSEKDRQKIYDVEYQAFNEADEALLVEELLNEPSVEALSLLAYDDELPVGHILFTKARVNHSKNQVTAMILAPMAILPSHQKQGIGGKLIRAGLEILKEQGVDLVFVLGHIDYYPRHGFTPAFKYGLLPPYPIEKGLEDAWMVQALSAINLQNYAGPVKTNQILDRPEFW